MKKKRTLSPEHLAKLQAGRAAKLASKQVEPQDVPNEPTEHPEPDTPQEQSTIDLQRQLEEMKQNMDLMRQALLNQNQGQGLQVNREGRMIGEFEKYVVDPANYPDPTPRLSKESRLAPLAFEHNYELTYQVDVSSYETKQGQHIREPKFNVTLLRVVLDDQGNRVQVTDPKTGKQQDKFYIARKLVFHEDPQAAMTIARENGVEIGDGRDEKLFLNEMRYLRVRDWLFDIFWPRQVQDMQQITEEAIGGQIVQVYTRNSEETGSIPFDQLKGSKLRA